MELNVIFEKVITPAIKEYNLSADPNKQLKIDFETKLVGHGSTIDSIGLVTLIVTIEENLYSFTGKQFTLASEKAVARTTSPFKTLGSLNDYIIELIEGK